MTPKTVDCYYCTHSIAILLGLERKARRRCRERQGVAVGNKSAVRKGQQSTSNRCKWQKSATPGTTLDGSSQTTNPPYDEEDPGEATEPELEPKTRKSGRRVSGGMLCLMCLCYVVSMLQFCTLGFWLHMTFFAYIDGEYIASTFSLSPSDERESVSSNDEGLLPELNTGMSTNKSIAQIAPLQ